MNKKHNTVRFLLLAITTVVACFGIFNFSHRTLNTQQSVAVNSVHADSIDEVEIPAPLQHCRELIIVHTGFTISYNPEWKIPNWVAYELTDKEVEGVVPREDHFVPDSQIPFALSASTNDYKGSGYDRGHMAPAGDMKWDAQAMKESFYLTNICPQNHNLNSGIWKNLEEQVRNLATQNGSIYVVCGPIMSPSFQTIGENRVAVPKGFFKALLQNNHGKWSAIAFKFDNVSGNKPLSTYALSISELQLITNIDFFPSLPDDIENQVENNVDFALWNVNR